MVLKGKARRDLQDYLAYKRAKWEIDFETDEHYREARERGTTIAPFDREAIVRSIPDTLSGIRLRSEDPMLRTILINLSDAFIKETQKRVPSWRRAIEEFGDE